MLQSLSQAFRLPDVRKRIIFTLVMFAVYVLGAHVPLPGLNKEQMANLFTHDIFRLLDVFSGGSFRRFSVFALGVMPYINASIIFQLLTIASKTVEEWQKEGEFGRKMISQWTRYLTVILAVVQASGLVGVLRASGALQVDAFEWVQIVLALTAGTCFLMWVGEQITDKGIGNGISLVIFVGIMATMPGQLSGTFRLASSGAVSWTRVLFLMVIVLAMVVSIIFMQQAHRKVPVQYTKRVVGNRILGGQSSFLPLKLNQAGVIPIIFAISIIQLPSVVATSVKGDALSAFLGRLHLSVSDNAAQNALDFVGHLFSPSHGFLAGFIYFALVFFFTYFYTAVTFKPLDVADDLKKWGGFIPGIRPGRSTAEHLNNLMTRITLIGGIFLGLIALAPFKVPDWTGIQTFSLVGGTSLLIVVGVALDTMQQLEAHLLMRQYEGFVR